MEIRVEYRSTPVSSIQVMKSKVSLMCMMPLSENVDILVLYLVLRIEHAAQESAGEGPRHGVITYAREHHSEDFHITAAMGEMDIGISN